MAKDLVDILPDVGKMRQSALAVRDAESASYAHYMATMLSASEAQREENKKLAEIRFKRHGIRPGAQQPSTQAILARPKEKDLEHFLRPLVDCQIKKPDGSIDVGERPVTIEEVSHVEATRRRPKNSTGQSDKSAFDEQHREAAANAFVCSPPAALSEMDKDRTTKVISYDELPGVAVTIEQPKDDLYWKHAKHEFSFKKLLKRLFG
jgi:hypothetical protein